MSEAEIGIEPEDPRQPDVRRMIAESDAYMQALYPSESNHLVDADALAASDTVFLVARRNGELLGSVAFRVITPGHAEMKRMFVRAEARGSGLGRRLLEALEDAACQKHISRISLETGIKQAEAIGLYRASGYRECPPFGTYTPDPLSLFMTKRLQP
jgi:putative acetyltransferase